MGQVVEWVSAKQQRGTTDGVGGGVAGGGVGAAALASPTRWACVGCARGNGEELDSCASCGRPRGRHVGG